MLQSDIQSETDIMFYTKYMKYKSKYMQLKNLHVGGAGTCAPILFSNEKQKMFEYYLKNALGYTTAQMEAHPGYSQFMQFNNKNPRKLPTPLVTKLEKEIQEWKKDDICPLKNTTTASTEQLKNKTTASMEQPCVGKSTQVCTDMTNKSVFDPNRGFLCRVNLKSKACEVRPIPGFQ